MRKYIAYLRVSTKEQGRSGLGIDAQRAIIEHYATIDEAQIIKEFVEIESGKDISNRPKLNEAIELCLKDKNYFLVVAKLDRLSRDVEHIFNIQKRLKDKFISCDLPTTDSLTLSIFAGLAQREREITSIRTKLALQQKKQQGYKLGKSENFTDEGRQAGANTMKAIAQQTASNKIAYAIIKQLRADGQAFEKIADELNKTGLKTARGKQYKRMTVKLIYDRFMGMI